MQSTIVITAGRNVGDEPMECMKWARYRAEIRNILTDAGGCNIVQQPPLLVRYTAQTGCWQDMPTEEACSFVVLFEGDELRLRAIRHALQTLGKSYGQDALGFIVAQGHNNLIQCNNCYE